jgi:tetratricopeptide (TPR) repeat protein
MLYDSTLRVPLICVWPGLSAPVRNRDPVSIMSVAPTLLDAAGLPFTVHHQAGSLRPALEGGSVACPVLYAETDEPYVTYQWSPLRSVRVGPLKYIHSTRSELYDYRADPAEEHDLAEARATDLLDMADRLAETQNGMEEGATVVAHLTARERAVLESLGYIGGGGAAGGSETELPDIKDRIHLVNMVTESHEMFGLGRTNDAHALLVEVARQEPGKVIFQKYLGRMELAMGRYQAAAATASRFLADRPDNLDMLQILGEARMREGAYGDALETFKQIVEASPDVPESAGNLAAALLKVGRMDEALSWWERALALGADPRVVRHNMALAFQQAGDLGRALEQWSLLLALDPLNMEAFRQAEGLRAELARQAAAAGE